MLGTDTVFTPELKNKGKVKKGDYPKGETLSVISTQILINSVTKIDPTNKSISPLISDEVQVINGPTTMGSEVGDRIGRGVAAIMKAAYRGQTPINIIAHSRGAVESLLIGHEVQYIQKVIKECNTLEELLKHIALQQAARNKAKTSSTPDILGSLKSELTTVEDKEAFFKNLKENMSNVSLNFFGIDPVPGDVRPITWYDDRFNTIPRIIKNTRIMYYENERSDWGFTPLDPQPEDPEYQNIEKFSIKGHHGTGSAGSDRSQKGIKVGPQEYKATQVQKLMIFMLLEFLQKYEVKFKHLDIFEPGRALGGKIYKSRFINEDTIDFESIYLDLYAEITKNVKAYDAYNETNYSYMGLLKDDRRILRNGKYGKFHAVFPSTPGYINEHHGLLMQNFFFKQFGLHSIEQSSLDQVVTKAHKLLVHHIKAIAKPNNESMSSSLNTKAVFPLLGKPKVREDILLTFRGLINRISQKYLTSDWSSDEKQREKIALFTAVKAMLSELSELSADENKDIQEFVGQLSKNIFEGIKEMVLQQYASMENDLNQSNISPDEELIQFFNNMVVQIAPELKNEGNEVIPIIAEIFAAEDFTSLSAQSLDKRIELIWEKIRAKLPHEQTKEYSIERVKTLYQEQFGDQFEDFENLYNRLQVFIADIEALSQLSPETTSFFAGYELSLRKKVEVLIDNAAKRFYNEKSINHVDVITKDTFRELVERFAIKNYGAIDPLKVLQQQKEDLIAVVKQKDEQINQKDEQFASQKDSLDQAYSDLNNPKEAKNLLLIEDLKKLTFNYLVHLRASESKDHTPEEAEALANKRQIVGNLLKTLSNSEEVKKPSERVNNFYIALNTAEGMLSAHRDAKWKRYLINALIIGAILISGILPGLAALAIYVDSGNKTSKSPLFWKSHGENVVASLKQLEMKEFKADEDSDDEIEDKPGVSG